MRGPCIFLNPKLSHVNSESLWALISPLIFDFWLAVIVVKGSKSCCYLNCNSNYAWNPVDVDLLAATNYFAGYNYRNVDVAEYTAPQLLSWC